MQTLSGFWSQLVRCIHAWRKFPEHSSIRLWIQTGLHLSPKYLYCSCSWTSMHTCERSRLVQKSRTCLEAGEISQFQEGHYPSCNPSRWRAEAGCRLYSLLRLDPAGPRNPRGGKVLWYGGVVLKRMSLGSTWSSIEQREPAKEEHFLFPHTLSSDRVRYSERRGDICGEEKEKKNPLIVWQIQVQGILGREGESNKRLGSPA